MIVLKTPYEMSLHFVINNSKYPGPWKLSFFGPSSNSKPKKETPTIHTFFIKKKPLKIY